MSQCPNCETKLTTNAKFCYSCGFQLTKVNQEDDLSFLQRTLHPNFIEIEKIGQGGMGSIFLGKQVSLNRKVVIKLLNEALCLDEKLVDNFLKEAQIAANLKHPNIVEMVDFGKAEGRPFFIMEYGEKGSFEKILSETRTKNKKLDTIEVCKSIVKILYALDFAHSKNLLAHLDIKPHNIIQRDSGEIFITDFGIALDKRDKITKTRESIGTPEYMSPEQIKGAKDIDARSDVYSVGILFFEMLTGFVPFESIEKEHIKEMHLKSEMPDLKPRFTPNELKKLEKENLNISDLTAIIHKACEKDREKRYFSCKEMAIAIESILYSIEEQKSESYKKHRKQITFYGVTASILFTLILYFGARQKLEENIKESCTNCCKEGNCINGKGIFLYKPIREGARSNEYEGEFKEGKKHGYGKYFIYSMQAKYEGNFINDLYDGTGTLINFNDDELKDFNSSYVGEFKANRPDGRGTYSFKNGSYFMAEFEDGKPKHDSITFITKEKSIYKGKFKDNEGTILPDGKGILIFSDNRVYIGEFQNGEIHGTGMIILPNHKVLNGRAENGRFSPDKK
ncbi:MAG TPA: protein kinase [Leptospiraceae bacterium]|nr:protein kinase [Leptospiraceae bacterium]HMW07869.1 protein kinase [Leptospiraceae bacterium]HMX32355.1 protein kinase [Leptospiraceae bacterium]HMY32674.1 protein kinase [Leptospiraceae bacterium]HMZ66048.1 protein kinase [Leptospiraceae bacterium]